MRSYLVAWAMVGTFAAAHGQAADHLLDILTYPLTPDHSVQGSVRSSAFPSNDELLRGLRASLDVNLLSLDRTDYKAGDRVIYELRIKNIGSNTLVLPWSPDGVIFIGPTLVAPPSIQAAIYLEVRDRVRLRKLARLDPTPLFGSPSVALSLEPLRPGETAWFRVPGFWSTSEREMKAVLDEPEGAVSVYAGFEILRTLIKAASANHVDVAVRSAFAK
jgi:hypothetical protein